MLEKEKARAKNLEKIADKKKEEKKGPPIRPLAYT